MLFSGLGVVAALLPSSYFLGNILFLYERIAAFSMYTSYLFLELIISRRSKVLLYYYIYLHYIVIIKKYLLNNMIVTKSISK